MKPAVAAAAAVVERTAMVRPRVVAGSDPVRS